MTDHQAKARELPQSVLDAGTKALLDFRKSGGDWTVHPAHAAEAVLQAALRLAVPDGSGAELMREDIDCYHKAMDRLGFIPRSCDNGRELTMFGRAMIGMVKYASAQRAAAIEEAVVAARSVATDAPDPRRAAAPTLADEGEKPSQAPLPPFGQIGLP